MSGIVELTKYRATDGTEFDTYVDATAYQQQLEDKELSRYHQYLNRLDAPKYTMERVGIWGIQLTVDTPAGQYSWFVRGSYKDALMFASKQSTWECGDIKLLCINDLM